MLRKLVCVGLLAVVAGCTGGPGLNDAPVSVTGKVADTSGSPVGGVVLNLQPLENGLAQGVEVKPDGTFALEAISGKYAYYFSSKSGGRVPTKVAGLVEPSMDRTVQVASGKTLQINLP